MLVGDRLRAENVDRFEAADVADTWREVFAFLAGFTGGSTVSPALCQAASVLRPPRPDYLPVYQDRPQ